MTCRRCQEHTAFLTESDRRCAFGPDGKFRLGNRLCATMIALQAVAQKSGLVWRLGTISVGDLHVVLRWRDAGAEVLDAREWLPGALRDSPLSLEIAEDLVASKERST